MLAFPLVGFDFLCFFFPSCCCCCLTNQVAMFWFLFLFWVSLVWLCGMFCFLALKPSLFVLFLFCFCLFCFSCWVLFVLLFLLLFYLEGFKGQVRWPFGPPHLTLKSSLVVFVVCFWLVFGLFLFVLE